MKPLHAGLLIAGAALAGGLAVKMSQPQPIPVVAPAPEPASAPVRRVVTPERAAAPAPLEYPALPKPSPFTARVEVARAEPEVYVESIQPPIRKNEPISTAKAAPPVDHASPLFVPPVPYQAPPKPEAKLQATPPPEPEPPLPVPVSQPRRVTIPMGMMVAVRVDQALSSDRSVAGDTFSASLAEPLVIDGLVIAERGARVGGRIVEVRKGERLQLELANLLTSDGQKIAISTDPWTKRVASSPGADAAKIGGGAALGAIIGGMAGGGKGAAIGAGIGGSAGVGAIALSRGKPAEVPPETVVRFRLATRVTITERQL